MPDLVNNLTSELQRQIDAFSPEVELKDVGAVLEAGDGIARVSGLSDVRAQELIQLPSVMMDLRSIVSIRRRLFFSFESYRNQRKRYDMLRKT